MYTRLKYTSICIWLLLQLFCFFCPTIVQAASKYQSCAPDTSCVVGEFLYDDSYVPISSATCTLTSRYPDATLHLNAVALTAAADGWYSYTFQAPSTTGLYRAQICCSAGSDYLCLDKSFTVETNASGGTSLTKDDVADAVWDEQRSSHTAAGSFGEALQNVVPSTSAISDAVWGYSSRNLSGFGSLISDMWGYSSRSIPNLTETKKQVDSVKEEVLYNQSLLEKLANQPVIKNYLESEQDLNLESKLEQSQFLVSKLLVDSYAMDSKLGMLDEQWKTIENEKLLATVQEISVLNGSIVDASTQIKNLWNFPVASTIATHVESLKDRISVIQNELSIEEKSTIGLEDLRSLHLSLQSVIRPLGTAEDSAGTETLFGKIREVKELADTFDVYADSTNKLLTNWSNLEIQDIQQQTNDLAARIATVNKLPKTSLLTATSNTEKADVGKKLKNRILSLQGTIQANKVLLAKKTSAPFSSSWLEEGSVIFKTLLTNPSTKITQVVPVKYYLPPEVKQENIIEIDEKLKTNFDVEKKQLYVEGEFSLAPFESKTISVRVEDVWVISDESLETLRNQAEELAKPLAKTSYFGQSVTIKSNINVALDKIAQNQKTAVTPEAKIRNYYEAQIELKAVREQLEKLQDLVGQAGSAGSLAGFVGGAQLIAVWGLVLVIVAGFVSLALYFRFLKGRDEKPHQTDQKAQPPAHHGQKIKIAKLVGIALFTSLVSSLLTAVATYQATTLHRPKELAWATEVLEHTPPPKGMVMGTQTSRQAQISTASAQKKTPSVQPQATVSGTRSHTDDASASVQQVTIKMQATQSAKTTAKTATSSGKTQKAERAVTILHTPTGYLNVRVQPTATAEILAKVYPGESYAYTEIVNGWYKITLADLSEGWVSKVYIKTQ